MSTVTSDGIGEEDTTYPAGEEDGSTTRPLGEEDVTTTHAIGEEGPEGPGPEISSTFGSF